MNEPEKHQIPKEEPLLRFIVDDRYSIYRRGILFLFLMLFLLFVSSGIDKGREKDLLGFYIIMMIALIGPILVNMFVLIPKFLFKGKYLRYFLWLILNLIVFYIILAAYLRFWLPKNAEGPKTIPMEALWAGGVFYIIILVILCSASAAIKLFQRWLRDKYRIVQLENSLLQTELDLLKTNISPHSLFNMLNSTEVLIQTDPLKARQIVQKLSEFLRYQLYDSNREKVLLSADILFLDHFLSLEKVRRDFFEFEIKQTGTHRQVEVSPLLFIPFVENAVKHNITSGPGAFVELSFILNEQGLVFTCKNPVSDSKSAEHGGFGLPNLKRRLELLYPGRHELQMQEKNGIYCATLVLSL
ncbi:sensor histidine kinase [Flavobacterium sp. FlaQc-48]|uniref:sensor histidine kinase n=1 Tax=Flavobacterium sp. FlaQc-48 TaxID=3374181 RepID=UPI003756DA50